MTPLVIGGELWAVVRVRPGDRLLVDRTGQPRLGTCDPAARLIAIDGTVRPPLLDRVVLHEVAHAITAARGMLPRLRAAVATGDRIAAEEWAAGLVEGHAIESVALASQALGRPVCIDGRCASW